MNTSMILVSLLLVGSVFIPFFLFNAAGKTERKKMKAQIAQEVAKNGLNVSKSETWGNTYIGIDPNQGKLLFIKILETTSTAQLFDLDAIKECHKSEIRKVAKVDNRKELMLERLDLQVVLKNGENLLLNYYDLDENRKEDFELQRIDKWVRIIGNHSSRIPLVNKVA